MACSVHNILNKNGLNGYPGIHRYENYIILLRNALFVYLVNAKILRDLSYY